MKYLFLICVDESVEVSPEQGDPEQWVEEMERRGVRLTGNRLCTADDATTVRDSGRLVTQGPFAETKEQIAGFDIIECADLDEAIEIASKHPVTSFGTIEVRPFWPE
ncbi:YciI family protein [Microbispora sp. NBC_01189]|uniref:YciI family protein n=1 Tax=Microbispora sp. NBC_01189 TaxID=2903583 RepID=UPI002E13A81B|nr:YciI family protein [Microbispora sp. NBC_01189]